MITKSAKKANRQNIKRRAQNEDRKMALKKALKAFKKLVLAKKVDEAKAMLPKIYAALDKTAKVHTIKKNTASRLKSRLTKMLARVK